VDEVELDKVELAVVLFDARVAEFCLHAVNASARPATAIAKTAALLWINGTVQDTVTPRFRKTFCAARRAAIGGIFESSPLAGLRYARFMLSAKPWKPNATLILCVFIFACYCLLTTVAAIKLHYSGQTQFDRNSFGYLLLATLSLHGIILVVTAAFLRMQHIRWAEAFGFSTPAKGRAILWGIFAALIFLPVGAATQSASSALLTRINSALNAGIDVNQTQEAVKLLTQQQSIGARVYMCAFAILIAPVAEEILFRGILYPAIKQAGHPRVALWSTSLVFGAIHFDIVIFLPLVILAMILVFLYERTDNLLAPIVAHSLFNTINVAQVYSDDIVNFLNRLFHHST
jgi:membrane protease YdiL (CAAX protease family)